MTNILYSEYWTKCAVSMWRLSCYVRVLAIWIMSNKTFEKYQLIASKSEESNTSHCLFHLVFSEYLRMNMYIYQNEGLALSPITNSVLSWVFEANGYLYCNCDGMSNEIRWSLKGIYNCAWDHIIIRLLNFSSDVVLRSE